MAESRSGSHVRNGHGTLFDATRRQNTAKELTVVRAILWIGVATLVLGVCATHVNGGEVLDMLMGDPWKCLATEADGKKATEEDGQVWTFKKDKIIWKDENGVHEVEYRLDESAMPVALDWWDPEPKGVWHGRCIIRCDGQTLQVCGRVGLKREKLERPKEFSTKGGGNLLRMAYFTRVK